MPYVNMQDLEGLIFLTVTVLGDDVLQIETGDATYRMYHEQDCCENVYLDEVIGDLDDLIGTPILTARESSDSDRNEALQLLLDPEEYVMYKLKTFAEPAPPCDESETWTFYEFRTIKGSVTLRWYGSSNGYYSESVSIYKET